jgi:DNA-directed RNA polymerase specialized sigma24 family protein
MFKIFFRSAIAICQQHVQEQGEDLAQEAIERFWDKLERVDEREAFSMRNNNLEVLREHWRKQTRRSSSFDEAHSQ